MRGWFESPEQRDFYDRWFGSVCRTGVERHFLLTLSSGEDYSLLGTVLPEALVCPVTKGAVARSEERTVPSRQ